MSPVCNALTGCTVPLDVNDPQRFGVSTYLDAYLDVLAFEHSLKVSVGYENITGQLGVNGERRSFFWSPDAKLYLKLEFQPDFLVKKPAGVTARGTERTRISDARPRR